MKVREFKKKLDALSDTNSRNKKKDIIRGLADEPAAISFLSGSEFGDAGLGKKTVHSCAEEVFGSFKAKPTVSQAVEQFGTTDMYTIKFETVDGESTERVVREYDEESGTRDLCILRSDMKIVANLSGNEQKSAVEEMFETYDYPSVVAHACLDDWPTGVSDVTIANALNLRDSLPFYDSVVDAARADKPLTEPSVGEAFSPQLAKSESSLPVDKDGNQWVGQVKLDGIRGLLHICQKDETFDNGKRVKMFSRRKNDITSSLPELTEIIFPDGSWIVDLEVVSSDGSYSSVSERIGRKAENVSRDVEMEFAIFDIIKKGEEYLYGEPFINRYGWTVTFADLTPDERVDALPIFTDEERAKSAASECEGLIWKRLDAPYEFGKRSKNWCKEKNMAETVDLVAAGFVEGEGRLDGTLGKVLLETADGHSVGATGSGFSDEERDEVWEWRDEYLGTTLEVEAEAFGEQGALRFPIFQRWRADGGEPDTLSRVKEILPKT